MSCKLTVFLCGALALSSVVFAVSPTPVPQPECKINNVCYVIDQSGSIDASEYPMEQQFVIDIATQIDVRSAVDPLNSAVAFSSTAQVIQESTANLDAFKAAVNRPRVLSGGTNMATGLDACHEQLKNAMGNRITVLLTDGRDGSPIQATESADKSKTEGISIITFGIGDDVDVPFLQMLATAPEFYLDASFQDLPAKVVDVVNAACNVVDVNPKNCDAAYADCEFKFMGESGLTKYDVTMTQDMSFTPAIVSKDATIGLGTLNTNGIIPEFIESSGASPITNFGSQSFTPTHFKPFWIASKGASGIGHQTFQGDQQVQALNRCVRVYFTSFQQFEGSQVTNRNDVPREENKCVVFRT